MGGRWYVKPIEHTRCIQCGKELTHKQQLDRQRYCSRSCTWKSQARTTEYTCKQCGISFRPKECDRTSYCSRECYFEYRRMNPKNPKYCKVYFISCCICGRLFTANIKTAKTCSKECSMEKARRNSFEKNKQSKIIRTRRCRECGKLFVPEYKDKRRVYCSDRCQDKLEHRERAVRKKFSVIQHIGFYQVLLQSDYKCGICGESIDLSIQHPDPMSAQIDHIIPLSKGGKHTLSNVQIAHYVCNTNKGTKAQGLKVIKKWKGQVLVA